MVSVYNTPNQIAWLTTVAVQAVAVLVMIILIYTKISSSNVDLVDSLDADLAPNARLQSVATYLGIFILSQIFEMGVSLDALFDKNVIQVLLLLPFQVAILVYSAFLPMQLREALTGTQADNADTQNHVRAYAIVIPSIVGAVLLVLSGVAYRLWLEMGWDVFKRIGADLRLKRMFTWYQCYLCSLKYSCFFCVGFSLQFLILVSGTPDGEFGVTIAALPITLAVMVLGGVAVRKEWRAATMVFMGLLILGMAYFIYKLVRIFDPNAGDRYAVARKTLTIFSVISALNLFVLFVLTGVCLTHFGQGLKDKIPPYSFHRREQESLRRRRSQRTEAEEGKATPSSKEANRLDRINSRMSMD